jgi:hypothetical protein
VQDLAESNLSAGLARSAMELERGRALQAAARERLITEAMERLESDLGQAARVAANEAQQKRRDKNEQASPDELLAELSELRRAFRLAQAQAGQPDAQGRESERGQAGNGGQNPAGNQPGENASSQTGQGGGQNGSPQSGGNASAAGSASTAAGGGGADTSQSASAGADTFGGYARGGSPNGYRGGYARHLIEGDRGRLNAWNPPLAANATHPVESAEFQRQAEEIGKRLRSLMSRLPQGALPSTDITALRQLASRLRRAGGDPMDAEYGRMMGLVDQVELAALNAAEKQRDKSATRAATPAEDAPEYRETVAEYYRRLGSGR